MVARAAAIGIILLALMATPIQANAAVISRVLIPPIVIENETIMLKILAVSASGYRVLDSPVGVVVQIFDFYHKETVFSANYSVFGEQIIPTTPLARGIYTVRVQMVGGRVYEDEVLVRPPPVPYTMDIFDDGFTFKSYDNSTFTIKIYVEHGATYDVYADYSEVTNLTMKFPHNGRFKVDIIDKWGWVNAFHNRDYWTGRGESYIWDFGWKEQNPAKARLPETTAMNVLIPAVAIAVVVLIARRWS